MSSSLHTGEFSPSDVKPGSGISRIWIYSRSERSNIDPDASAVVGFKFLHHATPKMRPRILLRQQGSVSLRPAAVNIRRIEAARLWADEGGR